MAEASKPLSTFTVGPLGFYEMCLDAICSSHIPALNGNLFRGDTSEMVYYLPGQHHSVLQNTRGAH